MEMGLLQTLGKEKLLAFYRTMLTIRRFEERTVELGQQNEVRNTGCSSVGEEAVAAGACASLEKTDKILSSHRANGHYIAKGASLKRMMAEFMGKKTGLSKGKGGAWHMVDVSVGAVGSNAIVGGQLPIAAGVALASKLRKEDCVTLCFLGDGAANEGTFHESLNLASVLRLPVIYICTNNEYCMALPAKEAMVVQNIADRASAYGMPGEVVDGNDVLAVYEAVSRAVRDVRRGQGPILLECRAHCWNVLYKEAVSFFSEEDDYTERTNPKLGAPVPQQYSDDDPLTNYQCKLLQTGILSLQEATKIEKEVEKEIEQAVEFARSSLVTLPEEVADDLFAASAEVI